MKLKEEKMLKLVALVKSQDTSLLCRTSTTNGAQVSKMYKGDESNYQQ